ncbi:hypothetical protein FIE12Z_2701 [Fusarium flagelliforme]|uniref:Uncharacterized protein n=1 Tax=Fusarium flagelliforme TaxID=2675880 RepID=A0A395MZT9_9HYPO|nr:hypothetical protein FIE12Z_2701 [Fusarium flagelliforme]
MEPLTQGQETPLPLIQPSRPASAPPVMYENDKTKEGRSYKQYRPAGTAYNLTQCTNQNPVRYCPGKIFKSTPGLWLGYTDFDMPIFDKHPVVEDTYPRLMTKIREQYSLCGLLCEERAKLWKFVHHREQEMLSEDVAFGYTWGHHNKMRVQWMEKIAAKQKELGASYETITTLMERVGRV